MKILHGANHVRYYKLEPTVQQSAEEESKQRIYLHSEE